MTFASRPSSARMSLQVQTGALLGALLFAPFAGLAQTPPAPHRPVMPGILDAIQPDERDIVTDSVPPDLSTYTISAELMTDGASAAAPEIRGSLRLGWTNTTGETLDALPFRLYANGPDREHDAITIAGATVDGEPVEPTLTVDNSILTVPFAEPLERGEDSIVELSFVSVLPVDSSSHYGIFGFDSEEGSLAMAQWYPIVAGRDPDDGWMLDPPSENGDPVFSDTALYDVSVRIEERFELVTTGVEQRDPGAATDGRVTRRFLSGPVRDFTMVADDDLGLRTRDVEGITINSWFPTGQERVGDAVATYTAQALTIFEELLGPYPYTELDIVSVPLNGAAGVEFPQLIYIGQGYYDAGQTLQTPNALDFTVAHEVIHEWFYALVGNNQYDHAFIDEGLTNFLSAQVYFERQYDEAVAARVVDRYLVDPFDSTVRRGDDQIVDQPTDDFPTGNSYVYAAYVKAPLGFRAIQAEIGDTAFFAALRAYVSEFQFRVATPDDLLDAFEEASGEDLGELWRHWFEAAEGERDLQD
ncbi:MAG: hypothetical protein AVDCRST_MAG87-2894 [uncultured Thermomicrobiales bacterium]|uniref:Peptidase M1 membrane alanine aminopeptidase domain-containing protein n=1 Tax=uncultured Thermomicrobiales bacterium TaxID=1645740 RepID=A0A6J4VH63_9BACT|nr:MAG: hypothetical protein AVDCRST_MAG87-2894 [uncultured Thermomicrobiales bacterium]